MKHEESINAYRTVRDEVCGHVTSPSSETSREAIQHVLLMELIQSINRLTKAVESISNKKIEVVVGDGITNAMNHVYSGPER